MTEGLAGAAEGQEVLKALGWVYLSILVVVEDKLGDIGDNV